MLKSTLGLLGMGVLLLGVLFAYVTSDSSQAKVTSLSDENMAQLTGGSDYTQGSSNGSTSIPECSTDDCWDGTREGTHTWYSCPICDYPETAYSKEKRWTKRTYWCDDFYMPNSCPSKYSTTEERNSCENSKGYTCF